MISTPEVRRLMVFSHPSHELGLFGLVQESAPRLLLLTDGAVERRIAESRAGLAGIGLEDQASYLEVPEGSVYEAFLDHDHAFFAAMVERVRETIVEVAPRQIFCDAVEFYNPSHDMTLPVVRAALAGVEGAAAIELFEVPMIWQPRDRDGYVVQRVMPSRAGSVLRFRLSAAQTAAKRRARDGVYEVLRADLGQTITDLPDEHLALEEVRPADAGVVLPPAECVLRYDRRGELLKRRGEVERAITYREHYVPVAERLFAA